MALLGTFEEVELPGFRTYADCEVISSDEHTIVCRPSPSPEDAFIVGVTVDWSLSLHAFILPPYFLE